MSSFKAGGTPKKRAATMLAAVLALGLVAAGCATEPGDGNETSDEQQAPAGTQAPRFYGEVDLEEPEDFDPSAVLNFGGFQEPTSLDPIKAQGHGTSGGNELGAVFDTLLSYNYETGEYEPQMAEGFAFSDEGRMLTLELRPDVTFTDGTPFNADAVIANFERHVDNSSQFANSIRVASMNAPDDLTVEFSFDEPNYAFAALMTHLPGMVVSPTAAETLGENFATAPVGAGPYIFRSWSPTEEIVLDPNPDYWGGQPENGGVRFVYLGASDTSWEAVEDGTIDGTFVRDAMAADRMLQGGQGFIDPLAFNQILLINNREGYAGQDVRIRQAVVASIDVDMVNDRGYQGTAIPTKSIYPDGSPLGGVVPGPTFDLEAAQNLVEEVKDSSDWDGRIGLVCPATAQDRDLCLAVEASLGSAGFSVDTDYVRNTAETIFVNRDYELAITAMSVGDTDIYRTLGNNYGTDSPSNVTGYSNQDFDEAIPELAAAETLEDRRSAISTIQEIWNDDPPQAVLSGLPAAYAWGPGIFGIEPRGAASIDLSGVKIVR